MLCGSLGLLPPSSATGGGGIRPPTGSACGLIRQINRRTLGFRAEKNRYLSHFTTRLNSYGMSMKKQFTPRDLWRFSYLSWPQVSPDGRLAAVVVRTPDGDGVCRPRVRVLDGETGLAVYETALGTHEMQPRFLPDGGWALLSDESGEYQVWTVAGDQRTQRTSLRHGVLHYDIAGGIVAFEAELWPEEIAAGEAFTEMSAQQKADWQAELALRPYVAEDLAYKLDEWYGMRKGELPRVGVTNGQTTRLMPQAVEGCYPALSPDGRRVAFFSYPHGGAKGRQAELTLWDTATGDATAVDPEMHFNAGGAPVFSADGRYLFATVRQAFDNGSAEAVARFDLEAGGATLYPDLSDDSACGGVNEAVIGRTENGENRSCFAVLPDRLLFLTGWQGRTRLFSVPLSDPAAVAALDTAYGDITGFAAGPDGRIAALAGTPTSPADLYLDGRRLTDAHAWLSEYEPPRTEWFTIQSRDGQAALQYALTYPAGYRPGVAYPAVLDIKGGPETMYGTGYWHEFHALSAAGFAVIHGNPRGSAGYGRAFRLGGVCWQDAPMNDLMDMCLDAVRRGVVDRDRIGVTGGSYGGYMTIKLITKTDFFAAAAGQRVFVNPGTSYGTGDVGWVSAAGALPPGFTMLKYLQDRARGSNASRVDSIRAPLLLLHGYRDYRCTFEQAEQLFIPLKQRHPEVPVRLVMFPNENHALTRTGNLRAQERHLQEIVRWFERYLAGKEDTPDEAAREH